MLRAIVQIWCYQNHISILSTLKSYLFIWMNKSACLVLKPYLNGSTCPVGQHSLRKPSGPNQQNKLALHSIWRLQAASNYPHGPRNVFHMLFQFVETPLLNAFHNPNILFICK